MLDIIDQHENPPSDHSAIIVGGALDVDSLDPAGIDQLMADRAIRAPQSWENWSLSTRIAWLKLQLENTPGPLALAKRASLFGEQSVIARGKAKSKVSLMASLAALASPIEGKVIGCESHDEILFPAIAESTPATAGADPLRQVIDEIESLDENQALAAVGKLTSQSEASLFRLGGVLSRLKAGSWRKNYPSFKAFVEAEHEVSHRTATRWMGVYRRLAESGVTGEQAQAIGWSKLKEIAGVVTSDNANVWIAVAARNSVAKLARIVASRKAGARQAIEDKTAEAATRMTVRLQSGQKETIQAAIEKAKADAGAGVAAGALERICANYVSGETLKREAEAMGLEACLRVIEAAYPNAKLKVAFVEDTAAA